MARSALTFSAAVVSTAVLTALFALALPAAPTPAHAAGDAFDKRLVKVRAMLEKRAPGTKFHVRTQKPFIIVGDGTAREVERRASGTVRWATGRLRKQFFKTDPAKPLVIYLFKGKRSYKTHAKRFFGDDPDTPYGYYSSQKRALIMNISTGGGTLVHELVHPYVEHHFPTAPSWLNEGLGSLFEASKDHRGKIVGVENWRLPGLHRAIKNGSLPSLKTMMKTSTNDFYSSHTGYAHARYVLMYLQERGLLEKFYATFHASRRVDKTGIASLEKVLGDESLPAFEAKWLAWVKKLRWRR